MLDNRAVMFQRLSGSSLGSIGDPTTSVQDPPRHDHDILIGSPTHRNTAQEHWKAQAIQPSQATGPCKFQDDEWDRDLTKSGDRLQAAN